MKTVLIVEDEEFNYIYLKEVLSDMVLKLIHAKDGLEAVNICKANPNIDLILMDIKMPVMDGHTATIQIKTFRSDLIIIGQSAYTMDQYIFKYDQNVFDDYMTKPISQKGLKDKVRKYLQIA